ncbi:universal stress protein [Aliamphritea spongicola]|nr:universal stress protein [Aliamphritea spongicola]
MDLSDSEAQTKALSVATEMARTHNAELHAVSIGSNLPDPAARTESERTATLNALVSDLRTQHNIDATAHEIHSVDPGAEMDSLLMQFIEECQIDLVVMSSHEPGLMEYIFPAHGSYIASHAKISVFVVR